MEAKISKTVRLSAEVIAMIEAQAGENFTAKFEALVTRCMWELPKKEQELADIQEQIELQRKNLRSIRQRVSEVRLYANNLETIVERTRRQMIQNLEALEKLEL